MFVRADRSNDVIVHSVILAVWAELATAVTNQHNEPVLFIDH